MRNPFFDRANFKLLSDSLLFLKKHYLIVLFLGLIAGFGRVAQLGGFGEVSGTLNAFLEIVVEGCRVLIFLFVLGSANIRRAIDMMRSVFKKKKATPSVKPALAWWFKTHWPGLAMSVAGFLVIAATINLWIDVLAYQTCLLLSLKSQSILVDTASEWTIILFFKNILVIPFTLVFETLLVLWVVRRDRNLKMQGG